MKIKEVTATSFEPVTIAITIESEKDLAWLFACSNCSKKIVEDNIDGYPKMLSAVQGNTEEQQMLFFNQMGKLASAKGLK